jgi:hypothetical protein
MRPDQVVTTATGTVADPQAPTLDPEREAGPLGATHGPAVKSIRPVYLVATARQPNPSFAASLARGLELARQAGARVVLYDHSTEALFVFPFEATGRIAGYERDCLLEPDELRIHGYDYLADQLVAARRQGLDVGAWLVFGIGASAMARCCKKLGVTRVVLPAKAARPSLRERLCRHTLAAFTARLPGVEFVLVPASSSNGRGR